MQAERELNDVGFQLDELSARLEEAENASTTQVNIIIVSSYLCGLLIVAKLTITLHLYA